MITSFRGEAAFLSNFYKIPGGIKDEMGILYPSAEHMFQAFKCMDYETRLRVSKEATPAAAKKAGGKYVRVREDWENVKIPLMSVCLILKFREPSLREKLKRTGDCELVEGNTWGDTFWGVCDGQGDNILGKLLMNIRGRL